MSNFDIDVDPESSEFWDGYLEAALAEVDPIDFLIELFWVYYDSPEEAAIQRMRVTFENVIERAKEIHDEEYAVDIAEAKAEYGEYLYDQWRDSDVH